jgi:hypothetical protein
VQNLAELSYISVVHQQSQAGANHLSILFRLPISKQHAQAIIELLIMKVKYD